MKVLCAPVTTQGKEYACIIEAERVCIYWINSNGEIVDAGESLADQLENGCVKIATVSIDTDDIESEVEKAILTIWETLFDLGNKQSAVMYSESPEKAKESTF